MIPGGKDARLVTDMQRFFVHRLNLPASFISTSIEDDARIADAQPQDSSPMVRFGLPELQRTLRIESIDQKPWQSHL
jgi:hypothetical protein